jgi:hypothetical protein
MKIEEKMVPKFVPGKAMKDAEINNCSARRSKLTQAT